MGMCARLASTMTQPLLIDLPEVLDGPRVRVRPFTAADAPAMCEAVAESRERLRQWLPWADGHRTVDESRAVLVRMQASWLLRQELPVGIFERTTGRLLGGSGLHRIDWPLRIFEIGYWLRRTAEGQGYVSEAVVLLTRLAFDTLTANRVEIRVDPANERSRRVAERLEFVLEGCLRRRGWGAGGQPADQLVFALLPEDYRRRPWSRPA
jgi:RimJ/RimL family protein N-acetyltransferase